jgi:hypothetical protein
MRSPVANEEEEMASSERLTALILMLLLLTPFVAPARAGLPAPSIAPAGPAETGSVASTQSEEPEETRAGTGELEPSQRLVVVWTSGDREVALKMVFMYTFNAKRLGWWEDVTLLIWGPSAKLLSVDSELQAYVAKMKEQGVHLEACKACADQYEVAETLEELGVTVRYTGQALTDYLKEGRHVITF